MPRPRRIALLISQDIGFCRRVLEGVHAYALTRRWLFHALATSTLPMAPSWSRFIARITCGVLRLWDGEIAVMVEAAAGGRQRMSYVERLPSIGVVTKAG
jgi:hypothetical protein